MHAHQPAPALVFPAEDPSEFVNPPGFAGSPSRGAEAAALTETGIPGTSCSDCPVTVTVTRPPASVTVTSGEMSTPEPICEAAELASAVAPSGLPPTSAPPATPLPAAARGTRAGSR